MNFDIKLSDLKTGLAHENEDYVRRDEAKIPTEAKDIQAEFSLWHESEVVLPISKRWVMCALMVVAKMSVRHTLADKASFMSMADQAFDKSSI